MGIMRGPDREWGKWVIPTSKCSVATAAIVIWLGGGLGVDWNPADSIASGRKVFGAAWIELLRVGGLSGRPGVVGPAAVDVDTHTSVGGWHRKTRSLRLAC